MKALRFATLASLVAVSCTSSSTVASPEFEEALQLAVEKMETCTSIGEVFDVFAEDACSKEPVTTPTLAELRKVAVENLESCTSVGEVFDVLAADGCIKEPAELGYEAFVLESVEHAFRCAENGESFDPFVVGGCAPSPTAPFLETLSIWTIISLVY